MSIESLNTERLRQAVERSGSPLPITKAPSFEWGFLIHAIFLVAFSEIRLEIRFMGALIILPAVIAAAVFVIIETAAASVEAAAITAFCPIAAFPVEASSRAVSAIEAAARAIASSSAEIRELFGDIDRSDVRLLGEELDRCSDERDGVDIIQKIFGAFSIVFEPPCLCGIRETFDGCLLISFDDLRESRDCTSFDAAADDALDVTKLTHFSGNDEGRRKSRLSRAAGTAYTVDVDLRILRHVEVVDVGDAGNIKTTGSDVGRYQDINGAFLELTDYGVTFLLRKVSVKSSAI